MIEESEKLFEFTDKDDDEALPISFNKKRHVTAIQCNNDVSKSWRIRDRVGVFCTKLEFYE